MPPKPQSARRGAYLATLECSAALISDGPARRLATPWRRSHQRRVDARCTLGSSLRKSPSDSAQPSGMRKLMSDWMVTPAYGRDLPFERIAINKGALCIECVACGRRSALTKE